MNKYLALIFLISLFWTCKKTQEKIPLVSETFTFSPEDEYVLDEKNLNGEGYRIEVEKIRDLYELLRIVEDKAKENEILEVTKEQILSYFTKDSIGKQFLELNRDFLSKGFRPYEIEISAESDANIILPLTEKDSLEVINSEDSIQNIETEDSQLEKETNNSFKSLIVSLVRIDSMPKIKINYNLLKKDSLGNQIERLINFQILDYHLKE